MLRVVNRYTYSIHVGGVTLLMLCLFGGMYWLSGKDPLIYLSFALGFEFLMLLEKFTYKIKIDSGEIEVTYYRLGIKKIKMFLLKDVIINVDEINSENGRLNVLEIQSMDGKSLHKVYDEEGFEESEFNAIVNYKEEINRQLR